MAGFFKKIALQTFSAIAVDEYDDHAAGIKGKRHLEHITPVDGFVWTQQEYLEEWEDDQREKKAI